MLGAVLEKHMANWSAAASTQMANKPNNTTASNPSAETAAEQS
jgi:hypothetical protein